MSYCRWSEYSDVYVIGTLNNQLVCCGCCMLQEYRNFTTPFAQEMLAHLDEHEHRGHKVPHYARERLRVDACADKLHAAGYVRQESRWQLPRQLGLTRIAHTDHWQYGPYPEKGYPTDYHIISRPERWVLEWAERIAQLPISIDERRRALRRVATDSRRRDALEAALTTGTVPHHVILNICTAELDEIIEE